MPRDLDESDCLELLDGIAALATATGTTLAGGDVTRAPVLTLAITVVGHAPRADQLIGREGAQVEDVLVLTGELGGAAAGLLLLERPELGASVSPARVEQLRLRQIEPVPRLAAGRALAAAGAGAMIDLSDGLGGDAGHIAAASGVGIRIDSGAIPLAEGVAEIATAVGVDPLELTVSGGEDYELLAALPRECLAEANSRVGEGKLRLTPVGSVVAGEGVEIRLPGGGLLRAAGFDQLEPPPSRRPKAP